MEHISDLPELPSKALVTDEARIAAQAANLPTVEGVKQLAALVVAQAARDIVLGKLTFRSAGEASKVARDFVAIAKDLEWDTEGEDLKKAESADERKEAFELFRQRAQQNLKKNG